MHHLQIYNRIFHKTGSSLICKDQSMPALHQRNGSGEERGHFPLGDRVLPVLVSRGSSSSFFFLG